MTVRLERCTLREWREGDEDALVRHANNRDVWRNLRDLFPYPYTREDAEAWIAETKRHPPHTTFAIEVAGEAAGGIGLRVGEDVYSRSAEIGFWLGETHWGRGIMTEAVRAVTEIAFTRHDIVRVHAGVFEWNPASMRVLEKAGYVAEGRMRRAATKDGRTIDVILYAAVR